MPKVIVEENVVSGLANIDQALSDLTEPLGDIGELLLMSTQDRMNKGEDVDGNPFAPRSQTTLDRYKKRGLKFGAPLSQSGTMRKGVHYSHGADWLEIGSNAIQAAVMQFGAAKGTLGNGSPWGDIPERRFLGVSEEDEIGITETINEWLLSHQHGLT